MKEFKKPKHFYYQYFSGVRFFDLWASKSENASSNPIFSCNFVFSE